MADPLFELLTPYFDNANSPPSPRDSHVGSYLSRLSTLSFADLNSNEPASLLQSSQSQLRNIQALSKRSHKAVIESAAHLSHLSLLLPTFKSEAQVLGRELPALESAASEFAQKYDRNTDNAVLDRRKRAGLLSRNVDRVSDVLDLPALLSSTITAAQAGSGSSSSNIAGPATSYASALDLHAHIRRLRALYPQSDLVSSIAGQSDTEVQNLATILISSLQSPSLKLAAAMRTVGLLRRVAPELASGDLPGSQSSVLSAKSFSLSANTLNNEGALGALFLICRLRTLRQTLDALEPLRDLADQETTQRKEANDSSAPKASSSSSSTFGSQSERYLKRYTEIFREQSFNILSMFKSIFPTNSQDYEQGSNHDSKHGGDPLLPLPSAVSSVGLHLVEMLEDTLREYLPNITDRSARESLLTQVLYCAGSLGRLGADFGMVVALLEEEIAETDNVTDEESQIDEDQAEWIQVMKKHKVQASRLEVLARGVGNQKKTKSDMQVPQSASSPIPSPQPA